MAKGLTPIIGLAVVVALAMVAVFGAMSLTPSPAQAQDVLPVYLLFVTVDSNATGFIPDQGVAFRRKSEALQR